MEYLKSVTVFTLLSLCPLLSINGQVEIRSSAFTGGGGTSSGGPYTLTGTIGQPIAGFSSSSSYAITSGFHATLEIIPDVPAESFEAWINGFTGSDLPPVGQRGPEASPAGDGLSNLLKYALGLNPMIPAADAAPKVIAVPITENGVERNFLAIELKRSESAAVDLKVEHSEDLASWDFTSITENIESAGSDGFQLIQLITGIAIEENSSHFLRLYITAN